MKKTILTRTLNPKLYTLFKSFWSADNTFIPLSQFNGYNGGVDYLLHILENYNGIIVNADEDFFLTDESLLDGVINQMVANDFAYCGVPDGGVISHRNNSPFNVGTFFNVFNVDLIKTKLANYNPSKVYDYANAVEKNAKLNEPTSGFLYWLHLNFKGANFTNIESTDKVSTVIKINDKPLGIHSWYSREYGVNPIQTERIDKCIEWALINRI